MVHRRTEQRRQEILDAALDCFSGKGFTATTMAEIRDGAGALADVGHRALAKALAREADERCLQDLASSLFRCFARHAYGIK